MNDISTIFDGTHQTPKYKERGIKFLSVENIKDLDSNKYISEEDFTKEFKNYPRHGDVLMTRIGDVGTTNVVKTNELLAYYVSLALIKPNCSDGTFLKYLIESSPVQNELWRRTLHIAFPRKINKNEIGKVNIAIPNLQEQISIAKLLKKVDDIVALHQRKINILLKAKQNFMIYLFPLRENLFPKLRLSGFHLAWEQCKLNEILKVNNGKDYKHLSNGDIAVYGTGGYMLSVDDKLSDVDGIGIGRKGTIDKPQFLKAPFWTVDTLFYLTSMPNYHILFLFYLAQNIKWKKFDESTGVPSLSKKTIESIPTVVPSLEEQEALGLTFKKIDEFIELRQRKLKLLFKLKETYLRKIFI